MPRLPIPGSDEGSWGGILNEFLSVEHNADGSLKTSGTLALKYTKPASGIPKSDLETAVQTTLTRADQSLVQANNLSDLADAATSRTNLGLGAAALKSVPAAGNASASEVVLGNDSRLSDTRTPNSHQASHQAGQADALSGALNATARVDVAQNGTLIGTRRRLNLIPGTGISLNLTDDAASEKVDVSISTSGSGLTIESSGTPVTQRTKLNFYGSGVTLTDNTATTATDVYIPSSTAGTNNGQMELIAENCLSSDAPTITFSAIPSTYRHLMVLWQARETSTGARMGMRFNADTGLNYDYSHTWANGGSVGGNVQLAQGYSEVNHIVGTDGTTGAGAASSGSLWFVDYARSGVFYRQFHGNGNFPWVGTIYNTVISGTYRSTAPLTDLSFFMTNAANFKAGTIFSLYGVKSTAPAPGQSGAPETINVVASVPSGQSLGAGTIADLKIPFDCLIDSIDVIGDQAGSAGLDLYSATTAAGIASATSTNTICGTNQPTLSNTQTYSDNTLTGWTTALTAGTWLRFVITSSSWFTRLSINVKIRRS